jgi:hypothetical protein
LDGLTVEVAELAFNVMIDGTARSVDWERWLRYRFS